MSAWPQTREELIEEQLRLGALDPPPWQFAPGARVGGVFVCFARGGSGPGSAGDAAWAAAAVGDETAVAPGRAGAPYEPGLLALREGAVLEAAVRALAEPPDVLLVDATGRDHPRRAGLAVHLGAVLDLPTAVSRTARSQPKASGRQTNAVPAARCASGARSSATGSARAREPARLPSTPRGERSPTRRPTWCWRRAEHGRRSRCVPHGAAPARRVQPLRPEIGLR